MPGLNRLQVLLLVLSFCLGGLIFGLVLLSFSLISSVVFGLCSVESKTLSIYISFYNSLCQLFSLIQYNYTG